MTINYTVEQDGALSIMDDNNGAKDQNGLPMFTTRTISAAAIAAHRRDPDFEAALPQPIKDALAAAAAPAPAASQVKVA